MQIASPSPSPSVPSADPFVAQRLQVRWENIAIAGAGTAVAIIAAVIIMATGGPDEVVATPDGARIGGAGLTVAAAGEAETLEVSRAVVAEAIDLTSRGSWDAAADRLATVPQQFREDAGADAATADLDARRARHATLRSELEATVEARRWTDAAGLLQALATLAPLDAELRAIQGQVRAAAAGGGETQSSPATETPVPEAAVRVDVVAAAAPATTTVAAPGSTGDRRDKPATRPPTTMVPAPAATTVRPTPPATTTRPRPAIDVDDLDIDALIAQLGVELTLAQRAELEAAVKAVLASGDVAKLQVALDGVIGSPEMAQLEASLQGIAPVAS